MSVSEISREVTPIRVKLKSHHDFLSIAGRTWIQLKERLR